MNSFFPLNPSPPRLTTTSCATVGQADSILSIPRVPSRLVVGMSSDSLDGTADAVGGATGGEGFAVAFAEVFSASTCFFASSKIVRMRGDSSASTA